MKNIKQMKFMMTAIFVVLLALSVTSCNNTSDPGVIEYQAIVTVESNMGVPSYLKSDFDGYTLIPTNISALKYSSSSDYATRAWIYFTLAEGETFVKGKTTYNITITGVAQDLVGKSFCDPADLEHNPGASFSAISECWGSDGYLTALFTTGYNQSTLSLDLFNMYIDVEKTTGNTLYVKLNQDEVITSLTGTVSMYYSFKLPTKGEIQSLKDENPGFNLNYQTNDSVNVVVLAPASSGTDLQSKSFKVRIPS